MSIEQTLAEREKQYGCFMAHAMKSQELKDVLREMGGWDRLEEDQQEALDMIAHKIARIMNGDPAYVDNWHDIAGYATLVENRLTEEQEINDKHRKERLADRGDPGFRHEPGVPKGSGPLTCNL